MMASGLAGSKVLGGGVVPGWLCREGPSSMVEDGVDVVIFGYG